MLIIRHCATIQQSISVMWSGLHLQNTKMAQSRSLSTRLSQFRGCRSMASERAWPGRRGVGIWCRSDTPDRQTGGRAVGQPDQRRQTPRGRVWVTGYVATTLPLQLVA